MTSKAAVLRRTAALFVTTATVGLIATPAYASFSLTSTSGEWSNPIGGSRIRYRTTARNENQIRWGTPAEDSPTGGKSGLGFKGIGSLDFEAGEVFTLGTLSHYNKTILGDTAASSADLKVKLDFGSLGFQNFDFTMNIDETVNDASYHAGGVCPYLTTGNGCSDSITWTGGFSGNTFTIGDTDYTFDLVGFSKTNDVSTIQDQFISQEGYKSEAYIFAQITEQDLPAQTVPEPAALLGLGMFGLAAIRSRRYR